MDAHDLFCQLTRGARFTKRKQPEQNRPKVKVEKPLSDEEESENEATSEPDVAEESNFTFLGGNGAVNESSKPKKPKNQMTPKQKEAQQKEEHISRIRKENRITVLGKNIPPPIENFEELRTLYNVSERLVKNLALCNYTQPTPIQMQAIPIMLSGRPLMACAQTGSGKTIAYLTPIINDLRTPQKVGFRAIVLAPTRELAQQIYRECVRLSEKTALKVHIISKVNQAEQKFGPNSSKKFDILISTPNRVRFLLQQEPPLIDLKSIEWFVIDEADRLMEEGQNNFKEQLDDVLAACTNSAKKLALFSATYTVPVAKWALKNLKLLARVTIGEQNAATELVEQELLFVGSESGKLLAMRDLVRTGLKPPVLVFVQSKDRAKQLFQELLYDGINVDVIHADRTQQQRDNCVRAFREGHIWVLICTELMGRGIDFKGVNLVINYDFPPSTISYIHRIGRTGRAGRPGRSITFFTQEDTPNLRSIAGIIKNSGGKVPEFMLKMKKARKTEKRKLADFAPKREDISTKIKPETEGPLQKSKEGAFVKKRKGSTDGNVVSKKLKRTNRADESKNSNKNKKKPLGKVNNKKSKLKNVNN